MIASRTYQLFQLLVLLMFSSYFGASPTLGAVPSSSDAMIDGLVHLRLKNSKLGFKKLEKGFRETQSISEKSFFAKLLAQADPRHIQGKKHLYAEFALTHINDLSAAEKTRLNLIMADGYFEAGNVVLAKRGYQNVIQIPNSPHDDLEYAHYKIGWVHLNQKRPDLAYRVWLSWLKTEKNLGLREDFLKNLGKAFVEQLRYKDSMKMFEYSPQSQAELSTLTKGFYLGILRDKTKAITKFRKTIPTELVWTSIVNQVLEAQDLLRSSPCDGVDWIVSSKSNTINRDLSFASLARCGKWIKSKAKSRSFAKYHLKSHQIKLSNGYQHLKPKGLDRFPQSVLLAQLGKHNEACSNYWAMSLELMSEEKLRVLEIDQSLLRLIESCDQSNPSSVLKRNRVLKFTSKPQFLNYLAFKKPNNAGALVKLLKDPDRSYGFFKSLSFSNELKEHSWKKWLIQFSIEKKSPWTLALLQNTLDVSEIESQILLVSKPFNDAMKLKDHARAYSILEKLLPLSKIKSLASIQLWLFAHIESPQDRYRSEIIERAFLIQSKTKKDPKISKTIALILLEDQDLSLIHKYEKELQNWIEKDRSYAQALFSFCIEDNEFNRCNFKQSPTFNQYLSQYKQLLENKSVSSTLSNPPAIFKTSRWDREIQNLIQIQTQSLYWTTVSFKDNPKLESQISREINKMNIFRKKVLQSQDWSHRSLKSLANQSYNKAIDQLSNAIRITPLDDKDAQSQLNQISQMIHSWRIDS